jgi:hypothetical protein
MPAKLGLNSTTFRGVRYSITTVSPIWSNVIDGKNQKILGKIKKFFVIKEFIYFFYFFYFVSFLFFPFPFLPFVLATFFFLSLARSPPRLTDSPESTESAPLTPH